MQNVRTWVSTLTQTHCKHHPIFPFLDYYWRDYNGVVPFDAFPAGRDINGNDTYIGQVYVHLLGLFVGQIIPGTTQVDVPCYGVVKRDYLVKVYKLSKL